VIKKPVMPSFANKKPESQQLNNLIVKLTILNCEATSRKIKVALIKVFLLPLRKYKEKKPEFKFT
jgi:hypothetical protein